VWAPLRAKRNGRLMAKKETKRKPTAAANTLDVTLPIYQIKITLEGIHPPIWRRIHVSDCSLDDLHDIIQVCFAWGDCHPHAFSVQVRQRTRKRGGLCVDDTESTFLCDLAERGHRVLRYGYDFGDSWQHEITIEATLLPEPGVIYPRCVEGQGNTPLEDMGGPYMGFLNSLAGQQDGGRELDIREWLPRDFDAEFFDLEDLNQCLRELRADLGLVRSKLLPPAAFQGGQRIRVKPGVVHPWYPDIPLGGWTGVIEDANHLVPTGYTVYWSEATLAMVHPVYFKRCQRDERAPDFLCIEELLIETVSDDAPVQIEQPSEIHTAPLSPDVQDDRIRMIFDLTSDDPLPEHNSQNQQFYREYLRANLQFPMSAHVWLGDDLADEKQVLVRLADYDPDNDQQLRCQQQILDPECDDSGLPLSALHPDEGTRNAQLLDDYRYWFWEAMDRREAKLDDEDEQLDDEDDEFEDDEAFDDEDDQCDDDEDQFDDEQTT
jgi:hypothetical protein